jgi:biopolymer transport protein ExbD
MSEGLSDGDEPEFQIAPLIDVLLVLLIFFMSITTVQVVRVDRNIVLPVATNALKQEDQSDQTIINVRWDASLRKATYGFEQRVDMQLDEIAPLVRERSRLSPTHRVLIRGDRLAPSENIGEVVASLARVGVSRVSFATLTR